MNLKKAFPTALAGVSVQGVSTSKLKEPCGRNVSGSAVPEAMKTLDGRLFCQATLRQAGPPRSSSTPALLRILGDGTVAA